MSYIEEFTEKINAAINARRSVLDAKVDPNVIRTHAFIEHVMDVVITLKIVGDPNKLSAKNPLLRSLLDDMSFGKKMKVLKVSGTISKETAKLLFWFNGLRKVSAHPSDKHKAVSFEPMKFNSLRDGLTRALIKSIDPEIIQAKAKQEAILRALKDVA